MKRDPRRGSSLGAGDKCRWRSIPDREGLLKRFEPAVEVSKVGEESRILAIEVNEMRNGDVLGVASAVAVEGEA